MLNHTTPVHDEQHRRYDSVSFWPACCCRASAKMIKIRFRVSTELGFRKLEFRS